VSGRSPARVTFRDVMAGLVGANLILAILDGAAGSWTGSAGFLVFAAIGAGVWRSIGLRPVGFRAVCNCGWKSSFYPHPQDADSAARAHTALVAHPRDGAS
jgi:hypothetical protein